jgi:hypothetical protein
MSEIDEIRRIAAEAGAKTLKELREAALHKAADTLATEALKVKNSRRQQILVITAGLSVSFTVLLGVFNDFGASYYQFLRVVVCAFSVLLIVVFHRQRNDNWRLGSIFCAVLYNPLLPARLSRSAWIPINLLTAIFLLYAVYVYLKSNNYFERKQT